MMREERQPDESPRPKLRDMFRLGEVFGYFFRRKDSSRPTNFNLRMMHGINRISIIIFLIAVIYLVLKRLL